MSHNKAASDHNNGYTAQAVVNTANGIIRHARWCQTLNPVVCYACRIAASPDELTSGDSIILPSLGVLWDPCQTLN